MCQSFPLSLLIHSIPPPDSEPHKGKAVLISIKGLPAPSWIELMGSSSRTMKREKGNIWFPLCGVARGCLCSLMEAFLFSRCSCSKVLFFQLLVAAPSSGPPWALGWGQFPCYCTVLICTVILLPMAPIQLTHTFVE